MLGDIVFAVASAPGAAERGIVRISGPETFDLVTSVVGGERLAPKRGVRRGEIDLLGFRVDVMLVCMPGPGSYTGEDVIELHAPGSPLLLARIGDLLRDAGARDATPGEFTRRAFENGRLDLPRAEAVGELIHAESQEARRRAVGVLEGGITDVVGRCRELVQDALAMLEAGLDFEDEDSIGAISPDQWLPMIERAEAQLVDLGAGVPRATAAGEIVVVGAANAGKSSLCNALIGHAGQALVHEVAGTTRDVLAFEMHGDDGLRVTLLDAPGDLGELDPDSADARALALRDEVALPRAAAALWVVDSRAGRDVEQPRLLGGEHGVRLLATVRTHLDLVPAETDDARRAGLAHAGPGVPDFSVSCTTGTGIDELRAFLLDSRQTPVTSPSGTNSRIAAHAARAAEALGRAHADGRTGHPVEVIALSVGEALAALDGITGHSEPDDLLDRIFARFCLGK